ncbi:KLTH0A07832p [Lachancea thermotolerans CBS 6340]|uniref:KLTH0A07832p n=1 Tax=Lachancea thermotolerans (strain ATCC 56472 / CBS 6340 / NRRL Y-8284) TaxID=559295 RepID=C5DC50_LACTC|nr:KLTH0A07832p [Lachancea thermotolerans CBS 6340]CAR21357.1 KLTH0A07832p [Lachancea thermotolerans CBS 6340]
MSEEEKPVQRGTIEEAEISSRSSSLIEKPDKITNEDALNDEYLETVTFTAEEEKALVRKIDLYILPLMCFVFLSQYLDKQSLSYATIFGLTKDLKMGQHDISWCSTIFSIGQLGANFVFTYLMTIVPRAPMTGACVVIWSVCCMCLAAPTTKEGFWVGRLFLGIFEAVVQPACVLITSYWYRKREQPLRTACWISMNAIAQIVGSFLMYGIGKTNKSSVADWKLMFIACGVISLVAGIAFYLLIPVSPRTAWFLTKREKEIAVKRLFDESDRTATNKFKKDQLFECFKFDWLFLSSLAFGFLVTVTSGTIIFQSLMLFSFGYDKFEVMKYGSPAGAVQLLFIWVAVVAVKLFPRERAMISLALVCVPLAGSIMVLSLKQSSGWWIIVGSWLGSVISCIMSILLSLISSNVRGNTKKSVCSNAFFAGYCLAAIIYPQWWVGTYKGGLIVNIIMWIIMDIYLIFYRFKAIFENKKRDKLQEEGFTLETHLVDDLTDKQNIHHRYVY